MTCSQRSAIGPDWLKPFYGSNFLYRLQEYTVPKDGLPQYGVTFSEHAKWGVNTQSRYWPLGVYFYYLTPACAGRGATGTGFATDRPWANVARLRLDRFVILNPGHRRHFGAQELKKALRRLRQRFPGKVPTEQQASGPTVLNQDVKSYQSLRDEAPEFLRLHSTLVYMQQRGLGRWERLLHDAGYNGVLDTVNVFLPIENCQGVETWPGGTEYIESIETPKNPRVPTDWQRAHQMIEILRRQKPGSLLLTAEQLREIMRTLPVHQEHRWDRGALRRDLFSSFLRAVDFGKCPDAWEEVREHAHQFYDDLERNPTTPAMFWKGLLYSSDHGARATARDVLGI